MGANCSRSAAHDVINHTSDRSPRLRPSRTDDPEREGAAQDSTTSIERSSQSDPPLRFSGTRVITRDRLFPLDGSDRDDRHHNNSSIPSDPVLSLFAPDRLLSPNGGRSSGMDGIGGIGARSDNSIFGGLPRGDRDRGTQDTFSFQSSRWTAPSFLHEPSSSFGDGSMSILPSSSSLGGGQHSLANRAGGVGVFSRRRISEEQRRNRELEEIERLQQDLAVMEAFFQTLLGRWAAMAEGGGNTPGGGMGIGGGMGSSNSPPPASESAVQQLPTVVTTAEDLVEESNRECCICFVDIHLGNEVSRLPCGHLYHKNCISEWLLKHCTCPVCRYELPTDDADYERGRVERMRDRKPRYRRYELNRMSVQELQSLYGDDDDGILLPTGKEALVEHVIASGRFDIIDSPEPVEYKLSDLRSMCVNDLQSTMTSAGVFVNPEEMGENKEDMIHLFVNSGRLEVLPEGGQQQQPCGKSLLCSCASSCDNLTLDGKVEAAGGATVEEQDCGDAAEG
uniref:RING-type E3 ubiquitin transferase n=1 Tax=Ditylum brightwellii TaxID=49249 RepID=A0A6V2QNW5_9STRA|mmetsp:Transcript_7929/g.11829  ORF Transcript_7929/g.11829 Transcript_7929/m.11829 type:complete len:508 (+) Transcript_7929:181-1704(+)